MGVVGHDAELPDLSPDGLEAVSLLRRRTLAALDDAAAVDSCDRVTVAALREELTVAELIRATGADESRLNNIASPVQEVRDVFDLMGTKSVEDWATIATRMAAVPAALAGYTTSLQVAAARGDVSAQRQVEAAIVEAHKNVGPSGFFASFVGSATVDGQPLAGVPAGRPGPGGRVGQ